MPGRAIRAHLEADGRQVVEVVIHDGYHPDAIVALAGAPLRLVFRREEDDPCTERVVFSSPRLDRHVPAAGTTTIELPAQPAGEVRFTCGMGRYRGRIELVDARATSIVGAVRGWASRLEEPARTAVLAWLGTLPVAALVGVLLLRGTAALLVAGAALAAWVAGWVWALTQSARSS